MPKEKWLQVGQNNQSGKSLCDSWGQVCGYNSELAREPRICIHAQTQLHIVLCETLRLAHHFMFSVISLNYNLNIVFNPYSNHCSIFSKIYFITYFECIFLCLRIYCVPNMVLCLCIFSLLPPLCPNITSSSHAAFPCLYHLSFIYHVVFHLVSNSCHNFNNSSLFI